MSISALSDLTGFDRRTVTKRLDDLEPEMAGNAYLYDTRDALRLLYGDAESGNLNPQQERAALDKERRIGVAMENQRKADELIPAEEVTAAWVKIIGITKDRLLALPSKMATEMVAVSTVDEAERLVTKRIIAALEDLSSSEH